MNKYVCIHGHFYQPPRENPWLEEIEVQDSAYPYRDWNERITAECYSPNTAARILSGDKKVIDIVNNYSRISFNFGPTLLSWMENHAPDVYNAILQADKESMEHFSGHGSAIAQVYNHMIMPLSNCRDKKTQVIWGIEDFKFRFGREPEGIWLAETAVDIETLDIAAEQGIKYTILAPRQAGRVKKINGKKWHDVSDSKVDPRVPYLCKLPSGRTINLFFYDGPISQDLAFGDLLKKGENLANRLAGTLDKNNDYPQIAHIATDGETYGHHQKHGDMALAYCLHHIEENQLAKVTIYGEFLEKFPPSMEVEIIENTSWSCAHGIERWRSDCGCNSGKDGWNQQWRAPLREALDWLRETIIPIYEKEAGHYTNDVWEMRDKYVNIILNRDPGNIKNFFKSFGIKNSEDKDVVKLLSLLEMQRHTMLMYTSCGWFFDEISGIETIQVVQYAARAIQLAKELGLADLETPFVNLLQKVPSNIPEVKDAANAYEMYVKPAIVDLYRVAAHYAVSSMFEDYSEETKVFSYEIFNEVYDKLEAGKTKMVVGRARMRSSITYEIKTISFAFLHLGDHNLNGGVREFIDQQSFENMQSEIKDAFSKLNIAEIILLLDKHFGSHSYTLWHLFKDESRKVFNKILQDTLDETEHSFRQIYKNHYPVMLSMLSTGTPLPKSISTAVEYVVNTDLKAIFENPDAIDPERLENIFSEIKKWNVEVDKLGLTYSGSKRINNLMEILSTQPFNFEVLKEIKSSLETLNRLHVELNLWKGQNYLFMIAKEHLQEMKDKAEHEDEEAAKWLSLFKEVERLLQVRIE